MDNTENPKMGEIPQTIHICKCCNYSTSSKKDFEKHKITAKHKRNADMADKIFFCKCGKSYKYRSGLCKHRKICVDREEDNKKDVRETPQEGKSVDAKTLLQMIQEDPELKSLLIDIAKTTVDGENIIINNNNNTQNNFHLNVFLEEQCKNAINFDDFVKRIQVTRDDVMNNGKNGFVRGMSDIINHHLGQMTPQTRPIHCTDIKRNTVYMRNNNRWTKDKDQINEKMSNAIRTLSTECILTLTNWKQENPDYKDGDSEFSQQSIYMMHGSMVVNGGDDPGKKVLNKVVGNIKLDCKRLT